MTKLKLGQTINNAIKIINDNFTELNSKYKILWSGSQDIPAKASGNSVVINLLDNISNYDGLILQLEGCNSWTYFGSLSAGKSFGAIAQQIGVDVGMDGWNVFGYKCEILSNTTLRLSEFIFTGSTLTPHEYLDIYSTRYLNNYSVYPLIKVIGIKLN